MLVRYSFLDYETGDEIPSGIAELREICGDDDEAMDDAVAQLSTKGRAIIGGGASPCISMIPEYKH